MGFKEKLFGKRTEIVEKKEGKQDKTVFLITEKNEGGMVAERNLLIGEKVSLFNNGVREITFTPTSQEAGFIAEKEGLRFLCVVSFDASAYGIQPLGEGDVVFPGMEPPSITNGDISIRIDPNKSLTRRKRLHDTGILKYVFDCEGCLIPENQRPKYIKIGCLQ